MLRVWQLYGDNEATPFGLSAWILVFFGLQLFLSQVTCVFHFIISPGTVHFGDDWCLYCFIANLHLNLGAVQAVVPALQCRSPTSIS